MADAVTDPVALADEIKGMVATLQSKQSAIEAGMYAKSDVDGMLEKMTARVDDLETKLNRPGSGTDGTGGEPTAAEQKDRVLGEYLRKGSERMSQDDRVILETKAMATDSDPNGGYLVSPTMNNTIISLVNEYSPIRAYADVETIGGDRYIQPRQDTQMTGSWTGERTTPSANTTPTIGMLEIPLRNAYAYPEVYQQMLDDAGFDVEGFLAREAADAFVRLEGESFINGDTVLEPEGILTNTSVLANYVYTGSASAITADSIFKAVYGIKDAYANGANWFMKRSTILQVALLKDGEGRSLFQMDPVDGKIATLHGYSIVPTADMPTMTTGTYPIMFANLRMGYKIIDKPTTSVLRDPYSSKPKVLFYFTKRTGGGVTKAEAIVPIKCATS